MLRKEMYSSSDSLLLLSLPWDGGEDEVGAVDAEEGM
jgi:hypothetical protein